MRFAESRPENLFCNLVYFRCTNKSLMQNNLLLFSHREKTLNTFDEVILMRSIRGHITHMQQVVICRGYKTNTQQVVIWHSSNRKQIFERKKAFSLQRSSRGHAALVPLTLYFSHQEDPYVEENWGDRGAVWVKRTWSIVGLWIKQLWWIVSVKCPWKDNTMCHTKALYFSHSQWISFIHKTV